MKNLINWFKSILQKWLDVPVKIIPIDPSQLKYTRKDIWNMSASEYRYRIYHEKGFADTVNILYEGSPPWNPWR